jgi:hypothetical protein
LLEEINNYPAETTHRLSIAYPARNYRPGILGQCVGRARTAFVAIGVARWGSAQLKRR